jgi:methylmalonyl-CoA mutase cobalamin-binding subunit
MPQEPVDTNPASGPGSRAQADTRMLRQTHETRSVGPGASIDAGASARSSVELGRELLAAISRLEGHEVSATLDRSAIALGLHRTVEEVLLPCMREVGTRWSRGLCDVREEQLTTTIVRFWLAHRRQEAPPPLNGSQVVLACGPLDGHTLALEIFDVLLSHAQLEGVNLGAQVSPAALATAVDTTSAQAVVLVSHVAQNRAAAVSALRAIEHSSAALFYAGAAFRSTATRQGVPGHYLGGNLSAAVAQVRTQLRTND